MNQRSPEMKKKLRGLALESPMWGSLVVGRSGASPSYLAWPHNYFFFATPWIQRVATRFLESNFVSWTGCFAQLAKWERPRFVKFVVKAKTTPVLSSYWIWLRFESEPSDWQPIESRLYDLKVAYFYDTASNSGSGTRKSNFWEGFVRNRMGCSSRPRYPNCF